MANQAKSNTLTFINFHLLVLDKATGEQKRVALQFEAANLTDRSAAEVQLALDLQNGLVDPEDLQLEIQSVRANVPARAPSGATKEQLLAQLQAARGQAPAVAVQAASQPAPAAAAAASSVAAANGVSEDDIPF